VISANQIIVKTIDGAIMVFENGSPTADAGQFLAEEKQQTQVLGAVSEVAPQHPIHWNQAQKYFDQFITVRGTVTTVENHLPKAMYLGFTKDIHRTFMFRVFAKDMDKFPYDLQSLQGKTVRVSGVVSLYWPTGSAAEINELVLSMENWQNVYPNSIGTLVTLIQPHEYTQRSCVKAFQKENTSEIIMFTRSSFYNYDLKDVNRFKKHIGIYAFPSKILENISELKDRTTNEIAESLEQLRWLDNGLSITGVFTSNQTISIDTPEDLDRVRLILK
jgi:hypothetical protein